MPDYRIVVVLTADQPPVEQTQALLTALEASGTVDTADVQERDPEVWSQFHTVANLR